MGRVHPSSIGRSPDRAIVAALVWSSVIANPVCDLRRDQLCGRPERDGVDSRRSGDRERVRAASFRRPLLAFARDCIAAPAMTPFGDEQIRFALRKMALCSCKLPPQLCRAATRLTLSFR